MPVQIAFTLLVAGCCATFFAVRRAWRPHVLVGWSAAFYVTFAPLSVAPLTALLLAVYFCNGPRAKWVAVGLVTALLVYFKGPGDGLAAGGHGVTRFASAVIVPIGFSYLSLELIHYAIERGRGKIRASSLVDFAAFALFFPCRLAGPIKRYPEFTAAVASAEWLPENVSRGALRILEGLAKKFAADFLGRTVAIAAVAATPLQGWESLFAYSLQLFLDFSAYSDLAIGVSRLMGITVPENFRAPYLSANIQQFWTRWHMSLSFWVRDYVFSPAGRALFKTSLKRHAVVIAVVSYMAAFLVVGAWHGLTMNFLVWGAYHGLLLSAYHVYRTSIPVSLVSHSMYQSKAAAWAGTGLTFMFVTIGWVFFRMELPAAARMLRLLFDV